MLNIEENKCTKVFELLYFKAMEDDFELPFYSEKEYRGLNP